MDAIRKAISEVKFRIPKAILEKTFINRYSSWSPPDQTSVDEQILSLVVKPRVLVDCNIVGGTQVLIPIGDLPADRPDPNTLVFRVPKTRTQGRSINSVLHVAFMSQSQGAAWGSTMGLGGAGNYDQNENTALTGAMTGVMAAVDKIPVTSTASAILIGENVVMVRDVMNFPINSYLRCILANDENLNNIQIRSYHSFAKLVEFAVKSYIYNTLVIEIDTAELQGGFNLGMFKTVMESYSDSEQNYQDYLKDKWQSIAFMSDATTYRRLVKMTIGGNR